ncbi:sce7726 family protein [Arthrobacter sp. NPDC080031]|uniref:sce7726 family protein n=1 Tax=Arthrobacter sp. NPDC080031 TaxID=3155918 RepID=UPI00344FF401
MRDIDVRRALHRDLLGQHKHDLANTRFVDELDLCGEVRVDVAVINGSLSGYELKSAKDTLRRLPKQVELYSKMLDYAVLVVAENHHGEAIKIIPEWWGVTMALAVEERISLEEVRPAEFNPQVDASYLARLLWRDEILAELTRLGLDKGVRSKPRRVLWERFSDSIPLDDVRSIVRRRLKDRTTWRADPTRS